MLKKKQEQNKYKNREQARNSVQSKIIEGVLNRLLTKAKVYSDENDMIEEIKLRQTVAEMFPEIQQSDLDVIFSKLENCTLPSKYLAQRKIYIPEFVGFLKSGPIFEEATDSGTLIQLNAAEEPQNATAQPSKLAPNQSLLPSQKSAIRGQPQ